MYQVVIQSVVAKQYPTVIDSQTGATALHINAAKNYSAVPEILLKHSGIDVDVVDNDGWTSLHAAAHWAQERPLRLLAVADARVDSITLTVSVVVRPGAAPAAPATCALSISGLFDSVVAPGSGGGGGEYGVDAVKVNYYFKLNNAYVTVPAPPPFRGADCDITTSTVRAFHGLTTLTDKENLRTSGLDCWMRSLNG
ncbi:unnamed protein product [Schistocephalus solidus]|uniref:ANK_REP_REGION domain-containing protein n=1 Tax=Schistocephalus solidus TaxID=70667 RepID=A0A183TN43_SCHSO|nr:unnamed protein product [Schistocephalus solidus]